jgi:hypothetical protein
MIPGMAGNGWRSQSVWLKLMLLVSIVLIAVGMYRCSMELTPQNGSGEARPKMSGGAGATEAP